ncbi:hypothetical protein PG997_002819 [Apiospora hydei]|uniref:Uncharacterized protein n=1 Tax=Apiospora hydei TaxID=1337664 RepID=A0ABR1WXK2_9PEZI
MTTSASTNTFGKVAVVGNPGLEVLENNSWESVAFGNNGSQLLSVLAVGASPGTVPEQSDHQTLSPDGTVYAPPVAYECLLQYCIHQMRANWTNNTFHEEVVSSWTNQSQKCPDLSCRSPFIFTSRKTDTTFYIRGEVVASTASWLSEFLNGNVTDYSYRYGGASFSSEFSGAIWRAMNNSATGFTDLMGNLADRLSLSLREIPSQPRAVGQSFTASYVAFVRWAWLTLPVFELGASLLFLFITMMETKRKGVAPWRNDILAAFFHGFDQRPVGRGGGHSLWGEDRQLLAEFHQDDETGGRLVVSGRQE